MRDMIVKIDPSFWSIFSTVFFGIGFIALVFWVCMPSRKSVYDKYSKIPLESE